MSILAAILIAIPPSFDPSFLAFDLDSLGIEARTAYNEQRWEDAATLYVEYVRHDPTNAGEMYNAACCFGLTGRDTLAALWLRESVRAGFGDPGFALEDPDFDRVRGSGFFSSVLDSLLAVHEEREARAGSLMFVETPALVPVRILPVGAPVDGEPMPLVVGLHGYGSNAASFAGLYGRIDSTGFIYAVPETPYPVTGGRETGFAWNTWSPTDSMVAYDSWDCSIELVRRVVAQVRERHPVSSVWLLGFSQGCALAYEAGLRSPDLVDGMICFGGWLDTTGMTGLDPSQHVFVAHGTFDRMVEPGAGREAFEILSSLGFDVELHEFEGAHTVPAGTLQQAVHWMRELDAALR